VGGYVWMATRAVAFMRLGDSGCRAAIGSCSVEDGLKKNAALLNLIS